MFGLFDFLKKEGKTGYCMKCRDIHEIKNGNSVTLKNGRLATKGSCNSCGTSIYRIEGMKTA